MTNKKAFTLVEMLIVITILSILAFAAVSSYSIARQRAQMDLAADGLVSTLKQQRELAKSGKAVNGKTLCYGLLFQTGEEPYVQYLQAPYVAVGDFGADYCDMDYVEEKPYLLLEGFEISEVLRDGSEQEILPIIFKPPAANVSFLMGNAPGLIEMELPIITVTVKGLDQEKSFEFNAETGLIKRI